jgi:uncharacterized membrane protein
LETKTHYKDFFKKLFEQSFFVICLVIALFFLVAEYKRKNDRDESILLNRVQELTKENKALYERLLNCDK